MKGLRERGVRWTFCAQFREECGCSRWGSGHLLAPSMDPLPPCPHLPSWAQTVPTLLPLTGHPKQLGAYPLPTCLWAR